MKRRFILLSALLGLLVFLFSQHTFQSSADSSTLTRDKLINTVQPKGVFSTSEHDQIELNMSELVVGSQRSFQIFDAADLANVTPIFSMHEHNFLARRGDVLFVLNESHIHAVNISEPSQPQFLDSVPHTFNFEPSFYGIEARWLVEDDLLILYEDRGQTALFFDLSNGSNIQLLGSLEVPVTGSMHLAIDHAQKRAMVTINSSITDHLYVIDIEDLTQTRVLSSYVSDLPSYSFFQAVTYHKEIDLFFVNARYVLQVYRLDQAGNAELVTQSTLGPGAEFAIDGDVMATLWGGVVTIYDIASLESPKALKHITASSNPNQPVTNGAIHLNDNTLSIAIDKHVEIHDLSDLDEIVQASSFSTASTEKNAIAVLNDIVYVADDNSVQIIDATNKFNPVEIGRISTLATVRKLDVFGTRLGILESGAVEIFDLTTPAAPELIARTAQVGLSPKALTMSDTHVYVAEGATLHIFELTDDISLRPIRSEPYLTRGVVALTIGSNSHSFQDILFIASESEISAYTALNPFRLRLIDNITIPSDAEQVRFKQPSITFEEETLYAAGCDLRTYYVQIVEAHSRVLQLSFKNDRFELIADHSDQDACGVDAIINDGMLFTGDAIYDVSKPPRIFKLHADPHIDPTFWDATSTIGASIAIDNDHVYVINETNIFATGDSYIYGYQFDGLYEVWLPNVYSNQ